MTRFVFLTDTHIFAEDGGYHQQSCYAEHLPELLHYLDAWMTVNDIDFVLHGGDVVDQVSEESIQTTCSLFDLSLPVYVCLGNHDVTHSEAAEMWLELGSRFFPSGELDYEIPCDDAKIHVMPTHWCNTPFFWDGHALSPHFLEEQHRDFNAKTSNGEKTQILCTHSEVAAVPTTQTGFEKPYHEPKHDFSYLVKNWVQSNPNIRCILSGHNHINTCVPLTSGTYAVTASSFTEVPFEFKVIDIESGYMAMQTVNLIDKCDFKPFYNYDKVFVQGRLKDRAFELKYHALQEK